MRGIGKAGLCALALTALVAAGCGSDDDEKSASSETTKPARGFDGDGGEGKDGGAAPNSPPGDIEPGYYGNGKDPFKTDGGIRFETRPLKDAGGYKLHSYQLIDGRNKANCTQSNSLQQIPFSSTSNYITAGSAFHFAGRWNKSKGGFATGKMSDDGNTVTLKWDKYESPFGDACGTAADNVVLTRTSK